MTDRLNEGDNHKSDCELTFLLVFVFVRVITMGNPDLFLLGFLLRLLLFFNLSQCLWRLGVWILGIVVLWETRPA